MGACSVAWLSEAVAGSAAAALGSEDFVELVMRRLPC